MVRSEGLPLLQHPVSSPRTTTLQQQQQMREAATRRRRLTLGGVLVALLLLAAGTFVAGAKPLRATLEREGHSTSPNAVPFAAVLDAYRATHDFDGVVQVRVNGSVVYELAAGVADEEFNVPMPHDAFFPIGSNSKLFVAVALYQLQERGRVNLSEPVNAYLAQQDFARFGFPNQTHWCPRVRGAASDAPCEAITFVQLLNMGSGIGDSLNCDNVPSSHCYATANNLAYYQGALAPYVGIFINDPLVFTPGTNYSYANPNYYLLSYLVETLSGMSLETYVATQITDVIGLTDTYFDPYAGSLHLRRHYVQQYVHYYAQTAPGTRGEKLATGTCSPYINSGAISGAGGLRSTVADMERWYLDLFANRGTTSKVLTAASIRMLVERVNTVNPMYGQGIGVVRAPQDDSNWPRELMYCGGVKCSVTCLAMQFPTTTSSSNTSNTSVLVGVFSNHMHMGFSDRDAFAAYHPTTFMLVPPPTALFLDGGGAFALFPKLVAAYDGNAVRATAV